MSRIEKTGREKVEAGAGRARAAAASDNPYVQMRLRRGWTQVEAARAAGINVKTLLKAEGAIPGRVSTEIERRLVQTYADAT